MLRPYSGEMVWNSSNNDSVQLVFWCRSLCLIVMIYFEIPVKQHVKELTSRFALSHPSVHSTFHLSSLLFQPHFLFPSHDSVKSTNALIK